MLLHAIGAHFEDTPDLRDAEGWIGIGEMLRERGDVMGRQAARCRAFDAAAGRRVALEADVPWRKRSRPPALSLSQPIITPQPVSPVLAAEASLREALVGGSLNFWEVALGTFTRDATSAVGDAVGITVAPLVAPSPASGSNEEKKADVGWLPPSTSPALPAEASFKLGEYIDGLVWPWLGAIAAPEESPSCGSLPATPSSCSLSPPGSCKTSFRGFLNSTSAPPPPLHRPLPDPSSPITPLSYDGKKAGGRAAVDSPTFAELELRRTAEQSFQHLFDFIASRRPPPGIEHHSPEPPAWAPAPMPASRWRVLTSKLFPNRLAVHPPRNHRDGGFEAQRGRRRTSEADDVCTLVKKLAANTRCGHISAIPPMPMRVGTSSAAADGPLATGT